MIGRLALAVALLLISAVACSAFSSAPTPELRLATGVVLRVDGEGAVNVTGFVLRTNDGTQLTFEVGRLDLSNGGLPAEHLRDHLRSGEPIEVQFSPAPGGGGGLVALHYTDAPGESQAP